MGLRVWYFMLLFVVAIVLGMANIPVLVVYLFIVVILIKKVQQEQRKGVPDYINSLLVKNSSSKDILADNVFENLEK
jgi:hypothetical protein